MIAVLDYGAGNLFSVMRALTYLGIPAQITAEPIRIRAADGVILPGVGAFKDAMEKLNGSGLAQVVREEAQKKPLLGICLGMQLLFDEGEENGPTSGLGLIPGRVIKLDTQGRKSPHVGWNTLMPVTPCVFSEVIPRGSYVYYVHSFAAESERCYVGHETEYGTAFPGVVHAGHILGTQFHPEKSGRVGLQILNQFGRLVKA